MAETQTTPPAQAGGFDPKVLGEAITAALATALPAAIAEANKPLLEALAKAQAAATPAPKDQAAKPLTAEDVAKLVRDQLGQHAQSQQSADARKAFAADKLKDLPEVYRDRLGTDPAKWAAEEQSLRQQFRRDLDALGVKPQPVAGTPPAGGAGPGQVVDVSKLNPVQLIAQGLKTTPVQGPTGVKPAATAAT